jgi:hypothetical protein
MPPPGWLFDDATGQTRWWDGRGWTDHTRPLDPVVRTSAMARPASLPADARTSSKNGPAAAAVVLAVLALATTSALIWLVPARDPFLAIAVGLAAMTLIATAFALAVVGLVIAIRRPTPKGSAVFALVMSVLLVGFFVFRLITAASMVNAGELENEITLWVQAQTGDLAVVVCPEDPPSAVGSIFSCAVTTPTSSLQVDVTVQEGGTVSWTEAP